MGDRSLAIGLGIARGLEKATENLANISQAKEKTRIEREEFNLNKKVKEAQLNVLEAKTSPEAMQRERESFKLETKQANAMFDLTQKKIGIAELNEHQKEIDLKKERDLLIMADRATLEDIGMTPEGARETMGSIYTPDSAKVDGREVDVASPEFVGAAEAMERGQADPFLRELGKVSRTQTGVTKEKASEELYGLKGEKLTEGKRTLIGDIRAAKGKNKSLEDINQLIKFEGYEPGDFADELEGYNPTEEETINTPGYFDEEESPVNKRNLLGIGQKRDKRTKNGGVYEKRKDGLWHLIPEKS